MHRMTISAILLWAGLSGLAFAHNPLDHPDWCNDNGRLVVVDEFQWHGEALAEWVRGRKGEGSCSTTESNRSGTKTCGQFDDDWSIVNPRASSHCDGFAVQFVGATHPDHGTVIVIAEGPEAFTDEERHHERYRARMGLHAVCVRCEPAALKPIEAGEPDAPVR